jgi:hypothetical protein
VFFQHDPLKVSLVWSGYLPPFGDYVPFAFRIHRWNARLTDDRPDPTMKRQAIATHDERNRTLAAQIPQWTELFPRHFLHTL